MADKVDGTDNVYVLGVKEPVGVIPAVTPDQVDEMLKTSLAIQFEQINDFVEDLADYADRPEHVNYGSLMKHLQSECVLHLSALAAAAILAVDAERKLREQVEEHANREIESLTQTIRDKDEDLRYWSNR